MSKRGHTLLLEDIKEAGEKILRYVQGMNYDDFANDDKTIDAVTRNFEIIGEAANRLDAASRTNNPHIEWDRIRGFRNRIVHEYFGVDYEIIWSIIESDLEELIFQLQAILDQNN